jgi:hypothetical protein
MNKGDYIYWSNRDGDSFPGIILDIKVKKGKVRYKIRIDWMSDGNGNNIDRTLWVSPSRVILQEETVY